MDKQEKRPIVVFDGDFTDTEQKLIPKWFDGDIVVWGDVKVSRTILIIGNMWVGGTISSGDINVGGDFNCYGKIYSGDINVRGNFNSCCKIYSANIEVKADFVCNDVVRTQGNIEVNGNCRCDQVVTNGNVEINGNFHCDEGFFVDFGDINVGGNFYCYEGGVAGSIKVRGDFCCSTGNVEVKNIEEGIQLDGDFVCDGWELVDENNE